MPVVLGCLSAGTAAQTTTAPEGALLPTPTDFGDWFGRAVDLDGDTLVVAASDEDSASAGVNGDPFDNSAQDAGAAYVFVRSGTDWVQQAYLKASNPEATDNFGTWVAISGDTLVVTALREDSQATGIDGDQTNNLATDSGAAYVFVRSGTDWAQQAYLKASDVEANDSFGWIAGIDGDTIVVGSPAGGDDSKGRAYVFQRTGTVWAEEAVLAPAVPAGVWARAVAISQDTIVVGSILEQVGGEVTGATHVFRRNGTSWPQEALLVASNADDQDRFGNAVSIDGDTVLVGADSEGSSATASGGDPADNSAVRSGAAYAFVRTGTLWSEQAYLKASNTDVDDRFGWRVAVSGDLAVVTSFAEQSDAIGVNGSMTNTPGTVFVGAAYAFERSGTTWGYPDYLKAATVSISDSLGWGVDVEDGRIAVGPRFGGVVTFETNVPVVVSTYCTAKASSAGCLGTIGTSDMTRQPVSGASDYYVYANAIQGGKTGILVAGLGPANLPFFGGTLCVQPPIKRSPLLFSGNADPVGCQGGLGALVNDGMILPQGIDAGPGNSGWYQFWVRDSQLAEKIALSNALQLDFQ